MSANAEGWLSGLRNLVSLSINGTVRTSPNLAALEGLHSYAGTLKRCESAFHAPNITEVDIGEVREGNLPLVPTQLRKLNLSDLQRTRELIAGPGDPQLRSLTLVGARRFDANSLRPFTRLEEIKLTQAVGIANLDALVDLPHLKKLTLSRGRDLDPIDSLLTLTQVDIHIRDRGPFAQRMTELADHAPNWHFH